MAVSYSHKFGQIIGDLLEMAVEPYLKKFADVNNLYLDKKGERLTRTGKKLSWTDLNNNKHDLDFVLERDGTDNTLGKPVAFIELAWRRYTKHSRNKAQEIQGAILPLAEKYKSVSPFKGVILAGCFTKGALTQLESLGFTVLYFSYESIVAAFDKFGIDSAFDENTTEEKFQDKIEKFRNLQNKAELANEICAINGNNVDSFFKTLMLTVSRFIERVLVLPLHGISYEISDIDDAIGFLKKYSEMSLSLPLVKYEIIITYNNGDEIKALFRDRENTIKFSESYR
jgi:hypothetical protein